MRKADLKKLKEGDSLLCIQWSDHFSEGEIYRVHRLTSDVLCVWCDDVQPHGVLNLDPKQFKKVD